MIARIRRMHDRVAGLTPAGEVYRASDPELLDWVQATAAYGFLQAYHTYVRPLSDLQRDRYYAERTLAASLYGARAPTSEAAFKIQFEAMSNRLERSDILFEFLAIMRSESVSKLDQGLQSFRSMRRMEASFKTASALRLRFSQSLASRRQRLSHAMVRSTIQRLGNCTNPLA